MPRPPKPPTFWARHSRLFTIALLILAVLAAIPGTYGLSAVFLLAALGVGTFASGAPRSGDGTYESGKGAPGSGIGNNWG